MPTGQQRRRLNGRSCRSPVVPMWDVYGGALSKRPRIWRLRERTFMSRKNGYGLGNLIIDVVLTCITGGFWLIWIFVREMRR